MNHYLYRITNNESRKTYIGVRSCECLPEQDPYMGSGKYIKRAIKVHGISSFTKDILTTFPNRTQAEEYERLVVDEAFVTRADTYNIAIGGGTGWYHVNADPNRTNPMKVKKNKDYHQQRMTELVKANKFHFGTKVIDDNPMKDPEIVKNHPATFTTENNPMNDPVKRASAKASNTAKSGRPVIVCGGEYPSLREAARCLGHSPQKLRHRLNSPLWEDHIFKEVV